MAGARLGICEVEYVTGGTVTYPAGARLAERVMTDFEFVWIQAGVARWHCNGQTHEAPPGAVILARPGFRDGYTWDSERVTRHAYFHFGLRGEVVGLPEESAWPLMRRVEGQDVLRPLLAFVVGQLELGVRLELGASAKGVTVAAAVGALLAAFVVGPVAAEARGVGAAVPEAVGRAAAYAGRTLAAEPAAAVTLADLAEAAAVSPKHLCRLFAQHVGQSPMQVVMTLRLQQAVGLLARSDLKLERIAEHCGFATVHHFSRRFRDVYGMPPGQAREELLAGRWQPGGQVRVGGMAVEY